MDIKKLKSKLKNIDTSKLFGRYQKDPLRACLYKVLDAINSRSSYYELINMGIEPGMISNENDYKLCLGDAFLCFLIEFDDDLDIEECIKESLKRNKKE